MNLKTSMELERASLNRNLRHFQNELKKMPPGTLKIDKNGNRNKWRVVNKREDGRSQHIYLSKDKLALAQQLAEKQWLESASQDAKERINLIDQFMASYPFQDYKTTSFIPKSLANNSDELKKLLVPKYARRSARIENWLNAPYEKSSEYPERLIVPTKAGIMVRSKSEAMIANELFDNGIPFRYECMQSLNEMRVYPDFTILDPHTLQDIVIWEHFGLADSGSYTRSAAMKMDAYLNAGYIPGWNLILTYETKNMPLDINYVSFLIQYHFL